MTDEVRDQLSVDFGPTIRVLRDTHMSWGQMLKEFIDNAFDARAGSVVIGRADDPSA